MKMDARITSILGKEKVKAFASVLLEDKFLIRGIKIVDGSRGRFVAMPARRTKKGDFADICFPITPETRTEINDAVLTAYAKKLEEM